MTREELSAVLGCSLELISDDYLPGCPFPLFQRKDMFRINTDTVLLSQYMTVKPGESVLDIGTNNGALLLAAAFKGAGALTGIDLHAEALALAEINLKRSQIVDAELILADICEFHHQPYDVIVCNPPYFKTPNIGSKNTSEWLRTARHEDRCTLKTLFAASGRLLKDKGRFYLVHRASRLAELFHELENSPLTCRKLRLVYDRRTARAGAVLMQLAKGTAGQLEIETPQWIE